MLPAFSLGFRPSQNIKTVHPFGPWEVSSWGRAFSISGARKPGGSGIGAFCVKAFIENSHWGPVFFQVFGRLLALEFGFAMNIVLALGTRKSKRASQLRHTPTPLSHG